MEAHDTVFFTDSFRLDGEGLFSWRQTGVEPDRLSGYERIAERWIGAYRTLAAQVGRRAPLMRRALGLNRLSRFETVRCPRRQRAALPLLIVSRQDGPWQEPCRRRHNRIKFLQMMKRKIRRNRGGLVTSQLIGTRIRALRQARGFSQDELARLFGFKDRQTVSAIETGIRRITASELLLAVEKFDVPLDYFTDPFRLDGEGLFSWRQTGVDPDRLSEYERTAGRWIGAYRTLAAQVGRQAPLMRRALGLNRLSRFEDAMDAGERFVAELGLGPVPALRLAAAMEEELRILVLMVDAQEGISRGGVPSARARRGADRAPRSDGTPQLRPGTRAIPHPHLGRNAARACGIRQ